VDRLVDAELRIGLEVLPNGGLRIVAGPPAAVREEVFRSVLDGGIEHDAIAADRNERRIGLQLSQNMLMGVVGIQADHDPLEVGGARLDLSNNSFVDGG